MAKKITASFDFDGKSMTNIDVVNPGEADGKTFLLEIGGGLNPLYLVVEANREPDAIDNLADSEEFGHHIVVDESDFDDYDPETFEYSGSGKIIDTNRLSFLGCVKPITCRYHGDGLPADGVASTAFTSVIG